MILLVAKTFSPNLCKVLNDMEEYYEKKIDKELPVEFSPDSQSYTVDSLMFRISESYRKIVEIDKIKTYFSCE